MDTREDEIPAKFSCQGADASPALSWNDPPAGTQSFALIVDDPDAPGGTFTHWLIYNIPATARSLPEGVPGDEQLADDTRQGRNDFERIGYNGPCPPPGKFHHYIFRLLAVDTKLGLAAGASKSQLEKAVRGHVLASAQLVGKFRR